MHEQITCAVSGRVQGVTYRDFCQRNAAELALVGFVRNKDDGSVEVVAQGQPDNLKEFIVRLHEGSSLAQVENVSVEWKTVKDAFDDFRIIFYD